MRKSLLPILALAFSANLLAQDHVQWRGENRDGVYNQTNLLAEWPAEGLKMLWHFDELGKGHTSATVTNNVIYVTGEVESTGYIFALDHSGKLLWKTEYGKEWDTSYPGTRTSVQYYKGKLYFMSAFSEAKCFDAKNGKEIWSVDMVAKFGARQIKWGVVEAPIILDDKIIFTPGGETTTMVALNNQTGQTIWQSKATDNKSAYCSPKLIEHNGTKLVVAFLSDHIVGVNALTGEFYWQHPQTNKYKIHPNTPMYKNGYICNVTGYGTGTTMLKLNENGKSVTKAWHNEQLDNQMGGTIWQDDVIIGSGHMSNRKWQAIDAKNGKILHETDALGKGVVIYADGLLYCYTDKGELGLMKYDVTKGFELISKFRIKMGSQQHWAHPVIANKVLYLRHGNVLMAYKISD